MEGRKALSALPEKVLLMYQAVIRMIGEGFDINKMKVSDITARAGIGKGTAYEYFSSKEEIIADAILYDVQGKHDHLAQIVKEDGSFREKFGKILDYMTEVFQEKETFCLLVRIVTGSYEISEPLRRECQKRQQDKDGRLLEDIVECLMRQAAAEGVIKERNPEFQKMAFVAQMIAFASLLVREEKGEETPISIEQGKEFVYGALVKSLN
ncbi:MAG: TetR/AcrR family transcriptional regulator [Roseburia sp.]|nr:TetR/AcrR family transcriptional regulator [Roseburia sp.]